VIAALGEEASECAILTASPLAKGPDIVRVPRKLAGSASAFGSWLKGTLRSLCPSAVVVDAFPLGILGELADHTVLPDVPAYHVARLLKWDAYRKAFEGSPRKYEESFAVEEILPLHEEFLVLNSKNFRFMDLPLQIHSERENPFKGKPVWLIVHSGPAAEVHKLLDISYKRTKIENTSPQFVVVSPRALDLPSGVTRMAHERAWELFPHAERIVTGCGFNSMLETRPWRAKHLFLPFERRFDDQALRALRA
jgi:hypothetical protein